MADVLRYRAREENGFSRQGAKTAKKTPSVFPVFLAALRETMLPAELGFEAPIWHHSLTAAASCEVPVFLAFLAALRETVLRAPARSLA